MDVRIIARKKYLICMINGGYQTTGIEDITLSHTWHVEHEGLLVSAVTVLDDDPVLALVGGLDLGDGQHDHVVVVAVADKFVPPTFLADSGSLTEEKLALFSIQDVLCEL